jgi:large subunit ribosomal protein L23Ae
MVKDTTKAAAAKKAALKGVNAKATKKIITSTSFRRPKTLRFFSFLNILNI